MNPALTRPTLFDVTPAPAAPNLVRIAYGHHARSLADLLHDALYLLLLLKNGHEPRQGDAFSQQIRDYLDGYERHARRLEATPEDIRATKYAICAAIDEAVLTSDFALRAQWERTPLQLALFGDQNAGEVFFDHLEAARHRGAAGLPVVEVHYMCLLAGFQGRYRLESPEKLNYLIATLDKEIAHLRGGKPAFAPHWKAPDQVRNRLRNEMPIWVVMVILALLALGGYMVFHTLLVRHSNTVLAAYYDLVQLPPQNPTLVITLP